MLQPQRNNLFIRQTARQTHQPPIISSVSADQLIPNPNPTVSHKKKHDRLFSKLATANFPPINIDTGNKIVTIKGQSCEYRYTENNNHNEGPNESQNQSSKKLAVLDRENLMRNFPVSYFENVDLLFKIISKKKRFIKNTYQTDKKEKQNDSQNSHLPIHKRQMIDERPSSRPIKMKAARHQIVGEKQQNNKREVRSNNNQRYSYRCKQSISKSNQKKQLLKVLSQQKVNKQPQKQQYIDNHKSTLYNSTKSAQKFRIKQLDKTNNANTTSQDQFISLITLNGNVNGLHQNNMPLQKKGVRFKPIQNKTIEQSRPKLKIKQEKQFTKDDQKLINSNRKSQQFQRRHYKQNRTLNSEHTQNHQIKNKYDFNRLQSKQACDKQKSAIKRISKQSNIDSKIDNNHPKIQDNKNQLKNLQKVGKAKAKKIQEIRIEGNKIEKERESKIIGNNINNQTNGNIKIQNLLYKIKPLLQKVANPTNTLQNQQQNSLFHYDSVNLLEQQQINEYQPQSHINRQETNLQLKKYIIKQQSTFKELIQVPFSNQKLSNSQQSSKEQDLTKTPHFHIKKQPTINIIQVPSKQQLKKQISQQQQIKMHQLLIPSNDERLQQLQKIRNNNLLQTLLPFQEQIFQKKKDAEHSINVGKSSKEQSIVDSQEINKFYNQLIELGANEGPQYRPKLGRLSNITEDCLQQLRKHHRDSNVQKQTPPSEQHKLDSVHSIDKAVMVYTQSDNILSSCDRSIILPNLNKKTSSKISIFSSVSQIQRVSKKKHNTIFEQEEQNIMYQTKAYNLNQSLIYIDLNPQNQHGPSHFRPASYHQLSNDEAIMSIDEIEPKRYANCEGVVANASQRTSKSNIATPFPESSKKMESASNISLLNLNAEQEAFISQDLSSGKTHEKQQNFQDKQQSFNHKITHEQIEQRQNTVQDKVTQQRLGNIINENIAISGEKSNRSKISKSMKQLKSMSIEDVRVQQDKQKEQFIQSDVNTQEMSSSFHVEVEKNTQDIQNFEQQNSKQNVCQKYDQKQLTAELYLQQNKLAQFDLKDQYSQNTQQIFQQTLQPYNQAVKLQTGNIRLEQQKQQILANNVQAERTSLKMKHKGNIMMHKMYDINIINQYPNRKSLEQYVQHNHHQIEQPTEKVDSYIQAKKPSQTDTNLVKSIHKDIGKESMQTPQATRQQQALKLNNQLKVQQQSLVQQQRPCKDLDTQGQGQKIKLKEEKQENIISQMNQQQPIVCCQGKYNNEQNIQQGIFEKDHNAEKIGNKNKLQSIQILKPLDHPSCPKIQALSHLDQSSLQQSKQKSSERASIQRVKQVNCQVQQQYLSSNQAEDNQLYTFHPTNLLESTSKQQKQITFASKKSIQRQSMMNPTDKCLQLQTKDIETNTLDLLANQLGQPEQSPQQQSFGLASITHQIINFHQPQIVQPPNYHQNQINSEIWDMIVKIFTFLSHENHFTDRIIDQHSVWLFNSNQNLSKLARYVLPLPSKANRLLQIKECLRRYVWSIPNMVEGQINIKLMLQALTGMPVLLLKETCYHKLDNLYRHNNIFGFTFGKGQVWRIVGTLSNKKNIQQKRLRLQKLSNKEIIQISWKKFLQHFKYSFIAAFSLQFYLSAIRINSEHNQNNSSFKLTLKGNENKKIHCIMGITSSLSLGKEFNGKMLVYGQVQSGKKGQICYKYLGSGDIGLVSMKLKEGQYIIVVELQDKNVDDFQILVGSESKQIVLKLQKM